MTIHSKALPFTIICLGALLLMTVRPAEAKRCSFLPKKETPQWIDTGFHKPGFYVGVGQAEWRKSEAEQILASKNTAYSDLASRISVKIESAMKDEVTTSSKGYKRQMEQNISVITKTNVKEALDDVNVEDQWLDHKHCIYWTLVSVSKASVEKAKKKSIMDNKFNAMMALYENGIGKGTVKNKKMMVERLSDARMLLDELDFTYLPEKRRKKHYLQLIEKNIDKLKKEVEHNIGRTLIAILSPSDEIKPDVLSKIITHIKGIIENSDRLPSGCDAMKNCLNIAKNRGFGQMALINLKKEITQSNLGSFKGKLIVDVTIYEAATQKLQKGPVSTFGHIIGWTEESLNWNIAVDKIIKNNELALLKK